MTVPGASSDKIEHGPRPTGGGGPCPTTKTGVGAVNATNYSENMRVKGRRLDRPRLESGNATLRKIINIVSTKKAPTWRKCLGFETTVGIGWGERPNILFGGELRQFQEGLRVWKKWSAIFELKLYCTRWNLSIYRRTGDQQGEIFEKERFRPFVEVLSFGIRAWGWEDKVNERAGISWIFTFRTPWNLYIPYKKHCSSRSVSMPAGTRMQRRHSPKPKRRKMGCGKTCIKI